MIYLLSKHEQNFAKSDIFFIVVHYKFTFLGLVGNGLELPLLLEKFLSMWSMVFGAEFIICFSLVGN